VKDAAEVIRTWTGTVDGTGEIKGGGFQFSAKALLTVVAVLDTRQRKTCAPWLEIY